MRFALSSLSIGLALYAGQATAQELAIPPARFPQLAKSATSATGFVPSGWTLESNATGDLNQDGVPDIVMVLHQSDPQNIIAHTGMGETPFNSNPRILAVAFGAGGKFTLALENHALIRRREDPVLADVLDENGGVSIDRGSVVVALYLFASAGGWDMGNRTFRFRYRKDRWELIGFDNETVNRGSGAVTSTGINYLTSRIEVGTGTIENDETKTTRKKLPKRPLLTIEDVGDGMEFAPAE